MSNATQEIDLSGEDINFKLRAGRAWSARLNAHIDLTGYTFEAQIRAKPAASAILAELDIVETDLPNGLFTIGQDSADDAGYYDLKWTPPGGLPHTPFGGQIRLKANVTRP